MNSLEGSGMPGGEINIARTITRDIANIKHEDSDKKKEEEHE
jgi:hypothetical protein